MEIKVRVFAGSNQAKITKQKDKYQVYVKSQANANAANRELLSLLAKEFKINKECLQIKSGQKSIYKKITISI